MEAGAIALMGLAPDPPIAGNTGTKKGRYTGVPKQQQKLPGVQSAMSRIPDCGEDSYRGSSRLTGECGHLTWPHFGRRSSRILAPAGW